MKQARGNTEKTKRPVLTKIGRSSAWRWASIIAVLIGTALLGAAVRAYNHGTRNRVAPAKASTAAPGLQGSSVRQPGRLHNRLSFQPEADKLRRRLGKRFTAPGRERATLIGTLSVGAQQFQARIGRSQEDDGEQVEIVLNGGAGSLTWNGKDGAKSAGRDAAGVERSLIERIALDSPDQFVLAQLRGANYFVAARHAIPVGVTPGEDYTGPVWEIVRVSEPKSSSSASNPQSLGRLYYINCVTGLIDKVISEEQGKRIEADMSNWIVMGGELLPAKIKWSQDGQTVMELNLSAATHGPGQ